MRVLFALIVLFAAGIQTQAQDQSVLELPVVICKQVQYMDEFMRLPLGGADSLTAIKKMRGESSCASGFFVFRIEHFLSTTENHEGRPFRIFEIEVLGLRKIINNVPVFFSFLGGAGYWVVALPAPLGEEEI